MSKPTKTIFVLAFMLALGAGVAVGMLTARSAPPLNAGSNQPSWLVDQLHLSAEQQQKMDGIWNSLIRAKANNYGEEFKNLQQQREVAIAGILNSDQKAQYEKINQDFSQKNAELWKRAEQDFGEATEKTRAMLDEHQRAKFDDMMQQFRARRGGGGNGGDWAGPAGHSAPSTMPAK